MDFVLDSFAILVLLERQNGWEDVNLLIGEAIDRGGRLYLSALNYGEIRYTVLRRFGRDSLQRSIEVLQSLPVEIVIPQLNDVEAAAELKAQHRCSYADCFAATLGLKLDIPVVTGDPEFKSLESAGLKVRWLPGNRMNKQ
jgi:ribonuclease VapC